jgi:YidC/Oxa1 family membrane protein insertase
VSATIWAGSTHVIRGRDGGCVPSWLSGLEGAVSCADSAARLGHDDKASVKTLRSAWQTKREDADPVTQAELDGAWKSIKNRRRSLYRFSLYAGPKDADFLKTSGHRLDASLDFGMLEFIGKPMLIAMRWFQSLTGDWALAIIMLTLIVKSVLLPLTNKSFKQMQRMSQLRPQLDELKEKHGDDREKFAKAQMALFKREGVNPLGGCLPMVIQMPIWFALYRTIYSSVELYHAPLGFWIQDLSAPDPLYIFPVILGFLMLAQSYFQPMAAGMDPVQAKMMKYGMPLMFSVFMIALPSGLVLYIMVNTLLTIFQNIHIRRSMA